MVTALEGGQPQFLSCVKLEGDLVLQPGLTSLPQLLIIDSQIDGLVEMRFVHFSGPLRLDGSMLSGNVVLAGSIFDAEVNWPGATFTAPPDEERSIDARGARFRSSTDMRALAYEGVDFSDSTFSGRTLFNGAVFRRDASFNGTLFEDETSFRGARFLQQASFVGATSLSSVEATGAHFEGITSFSRFAAKGGVNLRRADYHCDLSFDEVSAGVLDLTGLQPLVVTNTDCRTPLNGYGQLFMSNLAVDSLLLPLGLVDQIADADSQMAVLRLIEDTGREADDTALANSAFFVRKQKSTDERKGLSRLRWEIIESTTGYLVKPERLLYTAAVVFVFGAAVRFGFASFVLRRQGGGEPGDGPARQRALFARPAVLLRSIREAFTNAVSPKPPTYEFDDLHFMSYVVGTGLWSEYLLQKALLVMFLISLGNANPTLREIITSIG